jgi:hypothetical protein
MGQCAEPFETELHGLWDTNLVDRAIDNTPSKWANPLSSDIEQHFHGDKYVPLIRKVLVSGINQTWTHEFGTWVQCPAISLSASSSHDNDQLVLQSQWKPNETDDDRVCPWHWATPIHHLDCEWAWPKQMDEPPYDSPSSNGPFLQVDTDEYAGKIAKELVVEKLLTMAGLRLASILNQIFA